MNDVSMIKEMRSAIKQGDVERVLALINSDKTVLHATTSLGGWLHLAASEGQLEVVKCLVMSGADINARGGVFDGSALNLAASKGYIETVKYLLSHGAEVDVSEPERNPLFAAIYGGHLEVVKLLVDSGIDIHRKYTGSSMSNMDALAFAKERGQKEIALLLLSETGGIKLEGR